MNLLETSILILVIATFILFPIFRLIGYWLITKKQPVSIAIWITINDRVSTITGDKVSPELEQALNNYVKEFEEKLNENNNQTRDQTNLLS